MPNYNYYPQMGANPYGGYVPQQTYQTLNGKIVDSLETARCQEVPIGSVGYYPTADGSAIYKKIWKNDGTTQIVTYTPHIEPETPKVTLEEIQDSIASLNLKLDSLLPKTTSTTKGTPMSKVKKDE